MIRRDYILRMIEELRRVLEQILLLKERQRWQEVAGTLDQQFSQLVGVAPSEAVHLSEIDLLSRLLAGDASEFVRERTFFLIALFKEAGDSSVATGRPDEGCSFYVKGLELLLGTLAGTDPSECPDFVPPVEVFVAALADLPLAPRTLALLMHHYERIGEFSKAEDALYRLLDLEDRPSGVMEFGVAFYERLGRHPDEALASGNLPRAELEAGLAELRARKAGRS